MQPRLYLHIDQMFY